MLDLTQPSKSRLISMQVQSAKRSARISRSGLWRGKRPAGALPPTLEPLLLRTARIGDAEAAVILKRGRTIWHPTGLGKSGSLLSRNYQEWVRSRFRLPDWRAAEGRRASASCSLALRWPRVQHLAGQLVNRHELPRSGPRSRCSHSTRSTTPSLPSYCLGCMTNAELGRAMTGTRSTVSTGRDTSEPGMQGHGRRRKGGGCSLLFGETHDRPQGVSASSSRLAYLSPRKRLTCVSTTAPASAGDRPWVATARGGATSRRRM